MLLEWDERKAELNYRKHGVSFAEAATALRDDFAATLPDPDHSADEERFVTFGVSSQGRLLVVAHSYREPRIRTSAHARPPHRNEGSMKEKGSSELDEDLRPEYTPGDFRGLRAARGKFAAALRGSSNFVKIAPDVHAVFPNERAVNKALRGLIRKQAKTPSKNGRSVRRASR
jgi:uncharacterized DUF497 family protein